MRSYLKNIPRYTLLFTIKLYQRTISLDHGPLKFFRPFGLCKFRPTCSDYAYEAIHRYGAFKGGFMAFKRLIRCNPFNPGKYDPVA